jgi:hypothetical protein
MRNEIEAKYNELKGSEFLEVEVMMHFGIDRLIEELGSLEQFYAIFAQLEGE